jgi:DNA-binding transcriptional LysR family regulator
MNIDWLRYFIILSETRNFHSASEIIGITPPSLSNAISELENYYKLRLINRTHKVKGLTPAGEKFLIKAKEIILNIDLMNSRMSELISGEPEGQVSIAGGEMANDAFLPNAFVKILAKYPKIYPSFYSISNIEVFQLMLNGKIDMAILHESPLLPDFNYLKGFSFTHVIVGKEPENKQWHELSYITFSRLSGLPHDFWPDEKFKRKIIIEVDSFSPALDLCELGVGVAYVPEIIVKDKIAKGTLHIVAKPPVEFYSNLYLVWPQNITPTPVFSVVLDILSKEIR